MSVVYIEEAPEVVLDAHGAKLSYCSGGEMFVRRYPRGLWRFFLEREIRRLNEFEAAERESRKVVRVRTRAH
jgi:hypothetical protein